MEKKQFRLAVIGQKSSTLIFQALGTETHAVTSDSEAQEVLRDLSARTHDDEAKTPMYAVVFVEQNYYQALPDDLLTKLAKNSLPAVIPVPSPGSTDDDFSLKRLSRIVERAVGSDILN